MRLASFRSFAALIALAPLAAPLPAFAQGEAQQLPGSTAPTPGVATPQVTTPVALPVPNVSDPMLTPVPRAPQEISTWQEALDLLRGRSTDLRIAYDQVQSAVGQQREALAGALPQINASGSVTKNLIFKTTSSQNPSGFQFTDSAGKPIVLGANGIPTGTYTPGAPGISVVNGPPLSSTEPLDHYFGGSITAQQPILALRTWHAIGTAREITDAAKFSMEDLKRTLALGVANAIVGVVTAERVAELNRNGLQQSLARLDLTVQKVRLGASGTTGLDVVRAQQDVESARTTLVTGDESLRKARESLGLAVGIPAEIGVIREIRLDGLESDAIHQCKAAPDVDSRSDIVAAREKVHIADRNVDDVWLQFAPTINASSSVTDTTQPVFVSPPVTWNIMGVLSIPIWDGGNRYGELRDFRAQADAARQNLEASKRTANIQVQQAKRAVIVAQDELKVADRARALAIQNDEMTQTAYRGGLLTSLDLVTAAAARRQAEINYALDEFNLVQARVGSVLALANCNW